MSLFNAQPTLFNAVANGSIAATANAMIDKYGVNAVCRVITDGTPSDPNKPWLPSTATTADHNVRICLVPLSQMIRRTQSALKDTEVTTGMVGAYLGKVPFPLSRKCVVIYGGVQYRIVDVATTRENDVEILHELVLQP